MAIGKVRLYNDERGFGFITPSDGGPDVFFHVSTLKRAGMNEVVAGELLEYETGVDPKNGKIRASAIRMG